MNSQICHLCQKPLQACYPYGLTVWDGTKYIRYPDTNAYCQGHNTVECIECGWYITEGHHTPEDCKSLSAIIGKTKKTKVPKDFYKALFSK